MVRAGAILYFALIVLCRLAAAQDSYHCNAFRYAAPGFQSNSQLFPPGKHDPRVWDSMRKVAFQKSDCSWLAANFKDTGSQFVAILFAGFTQHKEDWPQPELALYLANSHGLSSLAVDPAGRGESCGYEFGPGYEGTISDMEAAVQFINSLPGRYAGALFGLSSGATSALFYASRIQNVPAIFTAEPDDMAVLPAFIDEVSGGDVIKRLSKVPELEITPPDRADRLILTAESLKKMQSVDLTAMVQHIPSDTHIYWYTAENGSSLTSEMKDLSFAHITQFQHQHFPGANHDFQLGHSPAKWLAALAADMHAEALKPAAAKQYIARHRSVLDLEKCWVNDVLTSQLDNVRQALLPRRRPGRQAMPKHIFINNEFRSSDQHGLVNPAAARLPSGGWYVFMMQYHGCFGSDCPTQLERGWNKPLVARMGDSSLPDPRNISHPNITAFHTASWAATVDRVGAHPLGGLRFTSFRPFIYQQQLHVSYAVEIFDKSLHYTADTPMDAHKMRFQGSGFSRLDLDSMQLISIAIFDQPLIPRREKPCCDKNWGLLEASGQLYIVYTVLPCLTVFKLDASQPTGASFVYASCISRQVQPWLAAATGLEMRDVRISGHPIVWSEYPQTLLVLVHHNWRRNGGSKHWGILIQFDPVQNHFMLTAVSAKPVMDHEDFVLHNEAIGVENVIAIGSYHLSGRYLRMLYGDGDKYSAYTDVEMASIPWVYLNHTSASEWTKGVDTALGDTIDSITYKEFESLVW